MSGQMWIGSDMSGLNFFSESVKNASRRLCFTSKQQLKRMFDLKYFKHYTKINHDTVYLFII